MYYNPFKNYYDNLSARLGGAKIFKHHHKDLISKLSANVVLIEQHQKDIEQKLNPAVLNLKNDIRYIHHNINRNANLYNKVVSNCLPLNYYALRPLQSDLQQIIYNSSFNIGAIKTKFKDFQLITSKINNVSVLVSELNSKIEFSSLTNKLKDDINDIDNKLSHFFGFKIIQSFIDLFDESEDKDLNQTLTTFDTVIIDKCNTLKPNRISFNTLLSIFTFFLSIAYTIYNSKIQENNIKFIISNSEQNLTKEIRKIQPQIEVSENILFYVVKDAVCVRKGPSTRSKKIDVIYPNNKVELIKNDGNWLFIEYFDLLEGTPKSGWVYKKYLHAINY